MTDWRDDPGARAAIERARALMAAFAQAGKPRWRRRSFRSTLNAISTCCNSMQ
jgi:hypothetical protein